MTARGVDLWKNGGDGQAAVGRQEGVQCGTSSADHLTVGTAHISPVKNVINKQGIPTPFRTTKAVTNRISESGPLLHIKRPNQILFKSKEKI